MPSAVGILADSKQQGPPFSPEQLTGLRVWFDASDSASITEIAGAVSQWNDKSLNGFHVSQATEANKPLMGTTNINDKNTLSFNGTTQFLTRISPVQIIHPTTGEWSFYGVWRTQTVVGTHHILDQDAVTGTRCAVYCRIGTTNLHAIAFDTIGTVSQETTTGVAANVPYYTSAVRNSTSVEAWRNNISSNGPITPPTPPQISGAYALGVGASRTGGTVQSWWQGDIAELIVYDIAHSSADRIKVQNYLKAKWGL